VELRQLRAVEAVARHRHFTRAADELRVAQSALSHQIRRLEQELGTPLFERTSRRVSPTEAGRAIAARARRILSEVDGAHQEVDELRGVLRGRIWIGALLPAGDLDVPGLLARFSRAHPGVEVGLREGIAADMLRFLAADELDAAFCLVAGEFPDNLAVERLSQEEAVAAFAPDRAPAAPRVGVADLRRRAIVAPRRGSAITAALQEMFAEAGEPLRLALESGDPFLLRSLAARGSPRRSFRVRSPPWTDPRSRCEACTPPSACPSRSSGGASATGHQRHARSSTSSAARRPRHAPRESATSGPGGRRTGGQLAGDVGRVPSGRGGSPCRSFTDMRGPLEPFSFLSGV
jgi:LysR family transcriptional regulator, transcription activator of glutamate synthase operon